MPERFIKIAKAYLILIDFILPIPLTVFMLRLWTQETDLRYALAIAMLGIAFGYIVPGIAARFFRLWEFTWPFRIKYCFVHHGFIYSGYFMLMLWLLWAPMEAFSFQQMMLPTLGGFAMMAFVGLHHDFLGISVGMIKNHTYTHAEEVNAWNYLSPIALICFGLIGMFYFACAIYGYYYLLDGNASQFVIWFILSLMLMFMALVPYFILHRKYIIRVLRKS